MRFSFFHFFIPFVVQARLWKSCTAYIYISTRFQQAWSSLVHSVGWIPFSFSSLALTKDTMWYMCFFSSSFCSSIPFFFNGLLPLWLDVVVEITAASCVCHSQSLVFAPSNYIPTNWKQIVHFFKVDVTHSSQSCLARSNLLNQQKPVLLKR